MKRSYGFTIVELIIVIVFAAAVTGLLLHQKDSTQATQRDSARKVAINAMYYNLEEVFFEENEYYPEDIDSKTLRAMDPALFTDPRGVKLGDPGSEYRYEAIDCSNSQCKGYTLRSTLEREADFVKTNRY